MFCLRLKMFSIVGQKLPQEEITAITECSLTCRNSPRSTWALRFKSTSLRMSCNWSSVTRSPVCCKKIKRLPQSHNKSIELFSNSQPPVPNHSKYFSRFQFKWKISKNLHINLFFTCNIHLKMSNTCTGIIFGDKILLHVCNTVIYLD